MIKSKKTYLLGMSMFAALFLACTAAYCDDTVNISDIAAAQEDNADYVETMSTTVTTEVEFDGIKKEFSYDYVLQQDENGNKKLLVTSHGVTPSQFMVDTAEGSVTILMADGSKKKFMVTDEQKQMMQQTAGISGMGAGFLSANSMFAMKGKGTVSDAFVKQNMKVQEAENDRMKIKVHKDKSNRRQAFVEYTDKDAMKLRDRLDEKMNEVELSKATTEGGKLLKERFKEKLKKHRDRMLEYNPVRRTEKINMETGMVEEQEMFNENGRKIGHMKVTRTEGKKVRISSKRKKSIEKKRKDREAQLAADSTSAGGNTQAQTSTSPVQVTDEKDIQVVTEMETQSETEKGTSTMRMKMQGTKYNETVEFKWMEVKIEK